MFINLGEKEFFKMTLYNISKRTSGTSRVMHNSYIRFTLFFFSNNFQVIDAIPYFSLNQKRMAAVEVFDLFSYIQNLQEI